jgi:hypothetical protein
MPLNRNTDAVSWQLHFRCGKASEPNPTNDYYDTTPLLFGLPLLILARSGRRNRLLTPAWWAAPVLRVSSHDQEILRLTLIAVRDAGRHHNDISCPNIQHLPVRGTEQHGRPTAGNTQDVMRGTMKVLEWVHAVAPCRGPGQPVLRCDIPAAEEMNWGWNHLPRM